LQKEASGAAPSKMKFTQVNAFPETNPHIPVSLGESKKEVHGLIDS